MHTPELTLDDLFKEAKAEMRVAAAKKTAAPKSPSTPHDRYAWPDNWNRGQNIGIMHKDTNTLLGIFSEWFHKTEPGVRKLVREEDLLPLHAIEEVSGNWGKQSPVAPMNPEACFAYHRIEIEVSFSEGLTAVAPLLVAMQGAAILFARTEGQISFGSPVAIVEFPADLNIFPALTRESKAAVRAAVESIA